jgi:acetyl esterase/lipase
MSGSWWRGATARPTDLEAALESGGVARVELGPLSFGAVSGLLAGQPLVYPNTDQLADDESMRAADDPFLFNRQSVAWYSQHYLTNPGDAANPLASPLRAESLAGPPPALVITAEYDPLRDQGEAYARWLAGDGVQPN